jgi:DNA-binding LytR/AlgR family response regulator
MKKINCIIAEDEKPAQRILESYIARIPYLVLLKSFGNAVDTLQFLSETKVDLIFLDINMPGMSGLEFLEALEPKPGVIITTAYSQFALDGFEHGVIDYLLKPFSFQRFCKAVNRYSGFAGKSQERPLTGFSKPDLQDGFVLIKTDSGEKRVAPADILFVESYGNYLKINCVDLRYIIRETLTGFLLKLPSDQFIRVHRSFAVAIARAGSFNGNTLHVDGITIPVGNLYKSLLRDALGM